MAGNCADDRASSCRAGIALAIVLFVAFVLLLRAGAGGVWATPSQDPLHGTLPTATPTSAPGGVCPTNTVLLPQAFTVIADLQRPNAPAPDPSWVVLVHLSLHPPGDADTVCHQWDLVLDQSGEWSGQLEAYTGLYDVRLKNAHTLRNVRRDVEITATNTIDMGTLQEGDANNDNRIRITDFGILRNAYFTDEGDPDFDPRADFDENGEIRIRDFSLLRMNYFEDGDVEVGGGAFEAIRVPEPVRPSTTARQWPVNRCSAVDRQYGAGTW